METENKAVTGAGNAQRFPSVLDILKTISFAERRRYVGYSIINGKIEIMLAD